MESGDSAMFPSGPGVGAQYARSAHPLSCGVGRVGQGGRTCREMGKRLKSKASAHPYPTIYDVHSIQAGIAMAACMAVSAADR